MSNNIIKRYKSEEATKVIRQHHEQTQEILDGVKKNGLTSVPGVREKFSSAVDKAREPRKKQ